MKERLKEKVWDIKFYVILKELKFRELFVDFRSVIIHEETVENVNFQNIVSKHKSFLFR